MYHMNSEKKKIKKKPDVPLEEVLRLLGGKIEGKKGGRNLVDM